MILNEAIRHAVQGNAVLFLGAGFSCEATNIKGKQMLEAREISKKLCKEMNLPENNDLGIVTDIYCSKNPVRKLIEILQNNYICKDVEEWHKEIASLEWRGVYTTNYDNVFEKSAQSVGAKYTPVTLEDKIKDYNKKRIVIHINGYINRLIPEKLGGEFKLTAQSYLVEDFLKSEWIDLFRMDVANARAIIFIGTSLKYDIDIQRILLDSPENKEKIVFIDRIIQQEDYFEEYKKSIFGTAYNIGVKQFADDIKKFKSSYIPKPHIHHFRSFTHVNNIEKKLKKIAVSDIWKALVYGDINRELIHISTEENIYLFERDSISNIEEKLDSPDIRCLIIHSDLGNGKTCLIETLAKKLCVKGEVFILDTRRYDVLQEVDRINSLPGRKYLIIENYSNHYDIFNNVAYYLSDEYKIILTARTYIHESQAKQLIDSLKLEVSNVEEISINQLRSKDRVKLVETINKVELWDKHKDLNNDMKTNLIDTKYGNRLNNTMLELIKSKTIKDSLDKLYEGLEKSPSIHKLFLGIFINNIMNLDLELNDLLDILDIKINSMELKFNEYINEIVDLKENKIKLKSPILAKHLIKQNKLSIDVLQIMKSLVRKCNEMDYGYKGDNIKKALISCSNLWIVLDKKNLEIRNVIIEYYDEIKDYLSYRKNLFFWLQYAIVCLDIKDFDRAENYFNIAYNECEEKDRKDLQTFDRFQINTQYARFLLEKNIFHKDAANPYEIFSQAHKLLMNNFRSKKNSLHYIFKQVYLYSDYYDIYSSRFKDEEKEEYINLIDEMLEQMEKYISSKENVETYVKNNRDKLMKCKTKLLQENVYFMLKNKFN